MRGLKYQLKNIRKDKLCILSFLLPVIAGFAINLLSSATFSPIGETQFCVLRHNLPSHAAEWLQSNGRVTEFPNVDALKNAVNDPATQAIGVLWDGKGIKTLLSGDELQLYTVIGTTLPGLYANRDLLSSAHIKIIPNDADSDGLKSLLIVVIMVTAMFMGCTFNAMSIIGEKEDGIGFINELLPMSPKEYVVQKIMLGFIGGILSTLLTACICLRISGRQLLPLLLMIILSSFVTALAGLFIGHFSNALMTGILSIKIVMILLLAPPILFYLIVPEGSLLYTLSFLFPSSAVFYGLMDLLSGKTQGLEVYILILFAHCLLWLLLFLGLTHCKSRKASVT